MRAAQSAAQRTRAAQNAAQNDPAQNFRILGGGFLGGFPPRTRPEVFPTHSGRVSGRFWAGSGVGLTSKTRPENPAQIREKSGRAVLGGILGEIRSRCKHRKKP